MPAANRRVADLGTRSGQRAAQKQFDRYGRALTNMSIIARIIGRSSPMVGTMIEQVSSDQVQNLADQYTKDLQREYTRQLNRRRQAMDQQRRARMQPPVPQRPSSIGTIADFGKAFDAEPRSSSTRTPWSWTDTKGWLG